MYSLADRLEHATATASNDDYSKPGTRERDRHVERIDVMQEAAAAIRSMAAALKMARPIVDRDTTNEEDVEQIDAALKLAET
jgi:hypothetical protein